MQKRFKGTSDRVPRNVWEIQRPKVCATWHFYQQRPQRVEGLRQQSDWTLNDHGLMEMQINLSDAVLKYLKAQRRTSTRSIRCFPLHLPVESQQDQLRSRCMHTLRAPTTPSQSVRIIFTPPARSFLRWRAGFCVGKRILSRSNKQLIRLIKLTKFWGQELHNREQLWCMTSTST